MRERQLRRSRQPRPVRRRCRVARISARPRRARRPRSRAGRAAGVDGLGGGDLLVVAQGPVARCCPPRTWPEEPRLAGVQTPPGELRPPGARQGALRVAVAGSPQLHCVPEPVHQEADRAQSSVELVEEVVGLVEREPVCARPARAVHRDERVECLEQGPELGDVVSHVLFAGDGPGRVAASEAGAGVSIWCRSSARGRHRPARGRRAARGVLVDVVAGGRRRAARDQPGRSRGRAQCRGPDVPARLGGAAGGPRRPARRPGGRGGPIFRVDPHPHAPHAA